jgi:hypothetical protein
MDGTPNLATQDAMSASMQSSAAMDFKGVASNHLDDLSTNGEQVHKALRRCRKWPDQVHVYVGETPLRYRDGLDRDSVLWAGLAT